jgi:hypothetical protein
MRRKLVVLLFVISCTFSCNRDSDPFSFSNAGVIKGRVFLSDNVFDASGTTVKIRGGSFNQTTVTEPDGRYQFQNVPTSNYEIEFTNEGYGEIRIFNIIQSGVDTLTVTNPYSNTALMLYRIPETEAPVLEGFDADSYQGLHLVLRIAVTGTDYGGARMFISDKENVSSENYLYSTYFDYPPGQYQFLRYLSYFLQDYPSAEKIYIKIYPDGGGYYFDYRVDRWAYSGINKDKPSPTTVFTLE